PSATLTKARCARSACCSSSRAWTRDELTATSAAGFIPMPMTGAPDSELDQPRPPGADALRPVGAALPRPPPAGSSYTSLASASGTDWLTVSNTSACEFSFVYGFHSNPGWLGLPVRAKLTHACETLSCSDRATAPPPVAV